MTICVVLDGARTPIGKLLGALASVDAVTLGATAVREAIRRSGISPDDGDAVVLGQVIQAGAGPNPARQAAAAAGIPMTVPAITINKLCLSGLASVAIADSMIRSGQHQVVVVGGMESMTGAPHLLMGSRQGWKYGDVKAQDSLDRDALVCAFDAISMGAATERYQRPHGMAFDLIIVGGGRMGGALPYARGAGAGVGGLRRGDRVRLDQVPRWRYRGL